ncbi:piggyBac transposable element-derived protein 4-like [Ostrinia furnacalis]|uniref:piggyBac transposable element-derived protein 4-like n=1 Tax=Ostrinia furnacalis TaxID=93504 RepID=UPI00103F062A|nr:piggyBac transposable element-derived protein 4-like [Ostrinia furnacalis]
MSCGGSGTSTPSNNTPKHKRSRIESTKEIIQVPSPAMFKRGESHHTSEGETEEIIQDPSPAAFMSCGGSGTSTPSNNTPKHKRSRIESTKEIIQVPSPAIGTSMTSNNTPKQKRSRIESTKPLTDQDLSDWLHYGSEDDSDDSVEDNQPLLGVCSRVKLEREMLDIEDEEEEEVPNVIRPVTPYAVDQLKYEPCEDEDEEEEAKPNVIRPASPITENEIDLEPRGLFDFKWKPFSQGEHIPPKERREKFTGESPGPVREFPTPYDAFTAIWTREFMEEIAVQTNFYAQQVAESRMARDDLMLNSRIAKWVDTSADELYTYFAIILATGLCIKTDQKEYFESSNKQGITTTPYFSNYMKYHRLLLLNKFIHFANNTENLTGLTRPQAKLFKIEPIITHLNNKFQELYRLGQNIALDESLTQWKGRLSIKQFIKNKVASTGIKSYEVCESQTGYLYRFKVHAGHGEQKRHDDNPVSGIIPSLVLELIKGLENKGHTLWMDNYYNSPPLARVLKSLGIDCVGTLRTNRKCVPQELANLQKTDMARGQISAFTSGDIDILVWRDTNRVAMISTYHGVGVHTVEEKTKPTVVCDYNLFMGGVDKKDQMLSTYPLERKRTSIWYKKFFRRLLNVSVLNAYVLHKNNTQEGANVSHRSFRQKLIKQLLENHFKGPEIKTAVVSSDLGTPVLSQEVLNHFPMEYGIVPGCAKNNRIRRTCVVCHKRQSYYCPACDKPLCITCTKLYHSRPRK